MTKRRRVKVSARAVRRRNPAQPKPVIPPERAGIRRADRIDVRALVYSKKLERFHCFCQTEHVAQPDVIISCACGRIWVQQQ